MKLELKMWFWKIEIEIENVALQNWNWIWKCNLEKLKMLMVIMQKTDDYWGFIKKLPKFKVSNCCSCGKDEWYDMVMMKWRIGYFLFDDAKDEW